MKLIELTEGQAADISQFKDDVRNVLWHHYKHDVFIPASEDHPSEMSDLEYLEFEEHVNDVVKFAMQHKITDAETAINQYSDSTRQAMRDKLKLNPTQMN